MGEQMNELLSSMKNIELWRSYNEFIEKAEKVIDTPEFKKFEFMNSPLYIEVLSYYALNHWDELPINLKRVVIARYPIFIFKEAYGKTYEEYCEIKKDLVLEGVPQNPLLKSLSIKLDTIANRSYFAFFKKGECSTGLTMDECKKIANDNNKGLVCFYLSYKLNEDLINSLVVYNNNIKTVQIVTADDIQSLIKVTNPTVSNKEYDIIIDKEECLICLDYGNVGFYSISTVPVKKKFVIENRCMYNINNNNILNVMKTRFMFDFNNRLSISTNIQDEMREISSIINDKWDDDKNKFIDNLSYLKEINYPFYLYMYWIKNDESIHTKAQVYEYAMKWIK